MIFFKKNLQVKKCIFFKILDDLEQIGGPVWVQFESSLIQTGLRLSGFFLTFF